MLCKITQSMYVQTGLVALLCDPSSLIYSSFIGTSQTTVTVLSSLLSFVSMVLGVVVIAVLGWRLQRYRAKLKRGELLCSMPWVHLSTPFELMHHALPFKQEEGTMAKLL